MKYRPLLCLTSLFLAPACGDDGGQVTPDASPDAMAVCAPNLPDPPPAATGDISGTFGVFTRYYANVQGFGGAQISRGYFVHEIVQNGEALEVQETMCNLEVDADDGSVHIRVLPAFLAAQTPVPRTGTLVQNGAGYDYNLDVVYIPRGVVLADPVNDPMPADASDPRVEDTEGDGNPGYTLLMDGILRGQLYVAQRDHASFSGQQVSADRVQGLGVWGNDITYLGANPAVLLDVVEPALPDPDPNLHTFQLARLPAGADCQYVLEHRCDLFEGVE